MFCLEGFIPIDRQHSGGKISIYFGISKYGYAWKIPSCKNIGVGMGELKIKGSKRTFDKFLEFNKQLNVVGKQKIRGAAISCGTYIRKPVKNNVLLVGDVAKLIDAITGEGIYFAIYSAELVALTIDRHFKKDESLSSYNTRIRKIHDIIRKQNFYNNFLYIPICQKIVLLFVKENHDFILTLLNDVISTYHLSYTKAITNWYKCLMYRLLRKR